MATPPQSTTTPRAHNISSLTIYAVALSILSGVTVSFVFYLCFGLLAAIVTFVLYSLALVGMYGCNRHLIEVVCYPRYGSLSERRKGEVDEVRVQGINRLMEGVTMTVQQEHLMHKTMTTATTATTSKSDSSITSATVECSASSSSSGSCTLEHIISSLESSEEDEDVELGHQANALTCHASVQNDEHDDDMTMTSTCDNDDGLPCHSSVQDDDEEHGGIAGVVLQLYKKDDEGTTSSSASSSVGRESAETEYTHVRIPCSSMMQCSSCSDTDPTLALASKADNDVSTNATPRTREVSINCPICLSSFEPHQSICYSSSPQCPHVFHSECLMRWFLEMGRQNDDIIIGHGTRLDESSLLEYTLSCPCCRQPFVQSELQQKDVGKEEKNVMDKIENRIMTKVTEVEEMEEDEEHESPV